MWCSSRDQLLYMARRDLISLLGFYTNDHCEVVSVFCWLLLTIEGIRIGQDHLGNMVHTTENGFETR